MFKRRRVRFAGFFKSDIAKFRETDIGLLLSPIPSTRSLKTGTRRMYIRQIGHK